MHMEWHMRSLDYCSGGGETVSFAGPAGAAIPLSLPRFSDLVELTEPSAVGASFTPMNVVTAKMAAIAAAARAMIMWRFRIEALLRF